MHGVFVFPEAVCCAVLKDAQPLDTLYAQVIQESLHRCDGCPQPCPKLFLLTQALQILFGLPTGDFLDRATQNQDESDL